MQQRLNPVLTEVPAFWILQTIGWTGYALDRYLSSEHFFPGIFIYTVVGCGLSFALRQVYKNPLVALSVRVGHRLGRCLLVDTGGLHLARYKSSHLLAIQIVAHQHQGLRCAAQKGIGSYSYLP